MSGLAALAIAGTGVGQTVYNSLAQAQGRVQFLGPKGSELISFDLTTAENYETQTTVTMFPIEDGSTISDHVILNPGSIDLTGEVTDTPVGGKGGLLTEGITTAANVLAGPLGVVAVGGYNYVASSKAAQDAAAKGTNKAPLSVLAYQALLNLQTRPVPFTVKTSIGSFPNLLITNLSVPRSSQTVGKLVFTVSLIVVRVVTSQTIAIRNAKASALASAKKKKGEVEAADPNQFNLGYQFTTDKLNQANSFVGNLSSGASKALGFGG